MFFSKFLSRRRPPAPRPPTCFYCLEEIQSDGNTTQCPRCKQELPVQYLKYYQEAPPFFIQVIGWSQVGKTVFLQALTLMARQLNLIWSHFSSQPVNDITLQYVREIERSLKRGVMPKPTPLGTKEVYVMLLNNMERWGGRSLVIRDCAGEIFDELTIPEEQVPFLKRAPTTFLMISRYDLERSEDGRTMDELLLSYINTMKRQGVDFKQERRNIVVVFSKADMIQKDLPSNLRDYLNRDPFWEAINASRPVESMNVTEMAEYVEILGRVSNAIKDWVQRESTGINLIRIAEMEDIELRFSLISSTGEPVDADGNMSHQLQPRRILDPYFWALEFQSVKV